MSYRLIAAIVAALFLLPPTATAQVDQRPANSKEIERLKTEGRRLFRVNKLSEALEKFEAALALSKTPDDELLFNLSFITWEQKMCEKYLLYTTGFLYMSPRDKEAAQKKDKRNKCANRIGGAGTLSIESIRPKSVEVRVNEVVVGRTPVYGLRLAPGDYNIEAETELYHEYNRTATVEEGTEARHKIKMRKRIFKGNVEVVTTPPGATVYLNHAKVGKSPWKRENLDTKRYLIRIEKPGWDRWVRYISVKKGETEKVEATLEKTGMTVPIPPLPKQDVD